MSDASHPKNGKALLTSVFNRILGRGSATSMRRLLFLSPIVGFVSGLGAVLFLISLDFLIHHLLGGIVGYTAPPTGEGSFHPIGLPTRWWLVLIVPTLGGLISGFLVFTWAPEAEGHGTDAMIRAFHRGAGLIRSRIPVIKGVSSIITIGTGGSGGQEGPIAQIGAGFGSYLARVLKLSVYERRLLMLAGTAGGVGAIFRAPLGGALFATEVLYRTAATEPEALIPCLASSIVAYSTFALFITPRPIFSVPPLSFHGLTELPLFVILALACTAVGWIYVKCFYGMRDYVFKPMPIPRVLKPAVGGLMLGLLALLCPQILDGGYGWVQWGAIGEPPALTEPGATPFTPALGGLTLLWFAFAKILATSFTISSGGSGGVFGPSVFIGGALGGAVGQLLSSIFPNAPIQPAAFALVGMAAFFAGVSKTPITSILMVCEMTGNYSLLVPLMLTCGLHFELSRRWSLYEEQVGSPIDSPAHQGDFVIDVLENMQVKQLPVRSKNLEIVKETTCFEDILQKVADSPETMFPVVDPLGRLSGIFTLRDIRQALLGGEWGPLVIVADIATRPVLTVTPDDDLHTALRRLTELNVDEIPVVALEDSTQLVGLLSRRDLIAAYTNRIKELRRAQHSDDPPSATGG